MSHVLQTPKSHVGAQEFNEHAHTFGSKSARGQTEGDEGNEKGAKKKTREKNKIKIREKKWREKETTMKKNESLEKRAKKRQWKRCGRRIIKKGRSARTARP